MKKHLSLLGILAFGMLAFAPTTELPIGAALPHADTKLTDVSGKTVTLGGAKRKNGLLVMFSCNTCPVVVKNQGRTKEIAAYALRNDIGVVLVNSNEAQRSNEDSYEAMKRYAKEQGYAWAYVVDENSVLADAFGATRTPENFLFDKEGKLVYHGAIDDNTEPEAVTRKHLRTAIDEVVAGKDVAVKTTRSVGCSIKRVK